MDVDSFMRGLGESSGDEDHKEVRTKKPRKPTTSSKKRKPAEAIPDPIAKKNKKSSTEPATGHTQQGSHAASLGKLAETDPDFFKFLQENDAQLLDFDDSEPEEDDGDGDPLPSEDEGAEGQEEEEEEEGAAELDMDDDDEPGPQSDGKQTKITLAMLKTWNADLLVGIVTCGGFEVNYFMFSASPGKPTVSRLVEAFRAAIERAGADVHSDLYSVDDSKTFGEILRVCFTSLSAAWPKLLRPDAAPEAGAKRHKRGKFPDKAQRRRTKYKQPLRMFLSDLLLFLRELQDEGVLKAALGQLARLAPYYAWFPRLTRLFVKEATRLWSRKRLGVRTAAFAALRRLLEAKKDTLDLVLRSTYLAYVANSKLVTFDTWPLITFMQKSFGMLCSMDEEVAYRQAFLYIRQMAIHLRNAIISKKKDMVRPVYNWQFVQCVYLWGRVLEGASVDSKLRQLLYPLIQIALGASRLVPSFAFDPLRYHCVRALLPCVDGSAPTGLYIPLSQLILEMAARPELAKRRTPKAPKAKGKSRLGKAKAALAIETSLRFRKLNISDGSAVSAMIEGLEELCLEWGVRVCGSLAFPELASVVVAGLGRLGKASSGSREAGLLRGASAKLGEQAAFVRRRRRAAAVELADAESHWWLSRELSGAEAPLPAYVVAWRKAKERTRQLKAAALAKQDEDDDGEEDESDMDDEGSGGSDGEVTEKPKKRRVAEKAPKAKAGRPRAKFQLPDLSDIQDEICDFGLGDVQDED